MTSEANRQIPLDVVTEILSWLPASSLVRFRRVCKLWRSITHDPHFIDTHLERALNARPPSILIFFRTRDQLGITVIDHGCVRKPFLLRPTPKRRRTRRRACGSCNGLLLISDEDGSMEVLNPVTGRSLTPPAPSVLIPFPRSGIDPIPWAYLGFHPATKEYKIIRFFGHNSHSLNACEVYTIGTGSWRRARRPDCFPEGSRAATVKGVMYWFIIRQKQVVSFDLKDESFTLISPPGFEIYENEETYKIHDLVELLGCVCLAVFTEAEIDIWMLNDDRRTNREWTRTYSVIFPWTTLNAKPLLIHDGKILMHVKGLDDYGSDKLDFVNLLRYHRLRSENGSEEEIYRADYFLFDFEPFVHVESLVPL